MMDPVKNDAQTYWKKCSSCRKPIAFSQLYWVCNVSTCNRKRTGLNFCEVSCWDAHLPMMNHREAWAEERTAPTAEQWAKIQSGDVEEKPRTRKVAPPPVEQKPVVSSAPKVIRRGSSQS